MAQPSTSAMDAAFRRAYDDQVQRQCDDGQRAGQTG